MVDEFSPVGLGDAIYEILKIPCEAEAAVTKGDLVFASEHVDDGLPQVTPTVTSSELAIGVAMNDAEEGEVVNVLVVGVIKVTAGTGGCTVGKSIIAAAEKGTVCDGNTAGQIVGKALQTAAAAATLIVAINCLGA